ncbi:GNAT family N-acetyltransferase [Saccharomonospora saliphila]|uniref:GNAT family N-acetyltransferase n=1 Tax=Saccharomonospora saliphila TaxID=369829 RepID=UPI00035EE0CE|nr:GNAT family protein [Saccharomonospora saliphila]
MLSDHFPVLGLRLRTPALELRLPDEDELAELTALALDGIHPPETMPFRIPWTERPRAELARGVAQHHWRLLGDWTPREWTLPLCVFHDGAVAGMQALAGRDFAILGEVRTGSWLGSRYQGRGLGTEMRAAVLHLAFDGLGAVQATSGAFEDNAASLAVSRKLGYRPDGIARHVVRGAPAVERRMRLTREDWRRHRAIAVETHGVAACLALFGADGEPPEADA